MSYTAPDVALAEVVKSDLDFSEIDVFHSFALFSFLLRKLNWIYLVLSLVLTN